MTEMMLDGALEGYFLGRVGEFVDTNMEHSRYNRRHIIFGLLCKVEEDKGQTKEDKVKWKQLINTGDSAGLSLHEPHNVTFSTNTVMASWRHRT
jgi:hypothetical protein